LDFCEEGIVIVFDLAELEEVEAGRGGLLGEEVDGDITEGGL
jgi:hypothetical protein